MIKLETKVTKTVCVKSINVHAKVCDRGSYTLKDENGETICEKNEDYVPSFFPTQHYGDYLDLEIDLETGVILNWKSPTKSDIEDFINSDED